MLINWLVGATKWTTSEGDTVYVGPCPFDWDKEGGDNTLYKPWVIDHEGMRDRLWRCTEIESFCTNIRKGAPIGMKLIPWSFQCS